MVIRSDHPPSYIRARTERTPAAEQPDRHRTGGLDDGERARSSVRPEPLRDPPRGPPRPSLGRLVRRDDPHDRRRRRHRPPRSDGRPGSTARRAAQDPRPGPALGRGRTPRRRLHPLPSVMTPRPTQETDMPSTTSTTPSTTARIDPMRRRAFVAGLLYVITFVSIPTLSLYSPVHENPDFVLGAGSDTGLLWGAFSEVVVALAGIGTAVVLFPVAKRQSETAALGFVTSRVLEAALILVGVVSLL